MLKNKENIFPSPYRQSCLHCVFNLFDMENKIYNKELFYTLWNQHQTYTFLQKLYPEDLWILVYPDLGFWSQLCRQPMEITYQWLKENDFNSSNHPQDCLSTLSKVKLIRNGSKEHVKWCGCFSMCECHLMLKLTCFSLTRSGPNTTNWITLAININEQHKVLTKTWRWTTYNPIICFHDTKVLSR